MKTINSTLGVFLLLLLTAALSAFSSNAMAQVSIDQLQVQGFMQQSNGTPVTNTTAITCGLGGGPGSGYEMAFGVSKVIGGVTTTIWGGVQCVTVQNGLFAVTLTGVGSNLGATGGGANLPAGTVGASFAQNFSATGLNVSLNAALLAANTGELSVLVYAVDPINTLHPFWTITITAVPTAMLAQEALSVKALGVTFGAIATGAYANTGGAGADNLLVQANSSGQIDPTFLPGAGTLPTGNGGTGATTLTQNGVLFGNGASPMGATAAGTNNTVLHGNTGAAPTYSAVDLTADVTGTLPVTKGGTGLATFAQGDVPFASAANTLSALGIGTSGKILNSSGTAPQWTSVAGLNLAGSGANGDITNFTLLNAGAITPHQGGTGLDTSASTGIPKVTGGTWAMSTAGTDFSAGTSGLATGLLKSTTGTGALSIATAGTDYLVPGGAAAISTSAAGGIAATAGPLTSGTAGTTAGSLVLESATAGGSATLAMPAGLASATTLTLPVGIVPGVNGQVLSSLTTGVMSWITPVTVGAANNWASTQTFTTGIDVSSGQSVTSPTLNTGFTVAENGTGALTLGAGAGGSTTIENNPTVASTVSVANVNGTVNSTTTVGDASGTTGSSTVTVGNNSGTGAGSSTVNVGVNTNTSTGGTTVNIGTGTSATAATAVTIGSASDAANSVTINTGSTGGVTFTDGNSLLIADAAGITSVANPGTPVPGLVLPTAPGGALLRGRCVLIWQKTAGPGTTTWEILTTAAPTKLWVETYTFLSTATAPTPLQTIIATATTTNITAAVTASAINLNQITYVDFAMQTTAAVPVTLKIAGFTSVVGDPLVVKAGSYCGYLP